MANRQNVIELNGQKYDARTGKIVTLQSSTPVRAQVKAVKHAGTHVDGFVRRKQATASTTPAKAAQTAVSRTAAPHAQKVTEKSKTLMRTSVKKPQTHKVHAKTTAVSPAAAKPKEATPLASSRDQGRLFRAKQVAQSNLIRKFNVDKAIKQVKTAHVPVVPEPQTNRLVHAVATPAVPAASAPLAANPFDKALEIANSHFQPKVRKVRFHERIAKKLHVKPRVLTSGLVGFVVLAAGGFWAYQNVPRVAMRIATTRAGVSATLPSYQPAGFSLKGPIAAVPGQVSLNYQSNSDERNFKVIQRSTNWDSQALLDNFVTDEHDQYQSLQTKGRTVFLYDSNATWVDGGVWYQIAGDAKLNRDQILRIVDGL